MSEVLLISHNTLPKKQFITRTEGNLWRLALHDDQVVGFFHTLKITEEFHCLSSCLFEEQLPDYHHWPLLHTASPTRPVSLHVTVLVCCCSFSPGWIMHSFPNGPRVPAAHLISHKKTILHCLIFIPHLLSLQHLFTFVKYFYRDFRVSLAPKNCRACTTTSWQDNNWKGTSRYWSNSMWWVDLGQLPDQLLPYSTSNRWREENWIQVITYWATK